MENENLKQLVGTLVRMGTFGKMGTRNVKKEVRKIIEGLQSGDDARASALARAKRDALEDIGAYLERLSDVNDASLKTEEALALTSGLVNSHVVRESTFRDGDREGISVTVYGSLSMSQLVQRLRALLEDTKQLERLKTAEKRNADLLKTQEKLEVQNRKFVEKGGSADEKKALKKAFRDNTRKIEAQDWYDKVKALWNGKTYTDPKMAVEYFDQAIRLVPDYPVYYFHRGNANYFWRQFKLAIRDFDKAVELDAKYADAFNNRGNTFYQQQKFAEGVSDYDRALKLAPKDADAHNNRGNAYYKQGYFKQALDDYGKAIKLAPKNPIYRNNRGITLDAMKEYKKALKDYTDAIGIDPAYSVAWYNRGFTHEVMESYKEALEDFNQAIRLNPKYDDAYYHRGMAYDKLGFAGSAKREWKKAAKLGNQKAREAMKKSR